MSSSGNRIVEVAQSQIGNTDQSRYGAGLNKSWCSEFVSWVYMQAGFPFSEGAEVRDGHLSHVRQIMNWFMGNSTFLLKGFKDWDHFRPAPGDYVCFGNNEDPMSHSGIVESIDDNGTLHTIEGNVHDAVVRRVYQDFKTNLNFHKWVQGFGLRCGKEIHMLKGMALASSFDDGHEPINAFDGNDATWWSSKAGQGMGQYLQMEWSEKKTITKISLKFGKHYPADYRFYFNIGMPFAGPWMPSTVIYDNTNQKKEHIWFRPVHHIYGVRLECLRYAKNDYFSVVEMKIMR